MWKPWWPAPRRRWLAWSRAAERLVRLVPRFSRTQSAAPGTEPLPPGPAFFCHQRGDSTISDARELAFVSRSTGARGWGCRSRAARRETAELLRGRHESGRTRPSRRAATGGRDEPDISDSRVKQSAQYLADILALNRAVDASFFGYSPLPTDRRPLTGIIHAETASPVKLLSDECGTHPFRDTGQTPCVSQKTRRGG
jgi:hypothetical protein